MKCKLCEKEISVPKIFCPICGEEQNMISNGLVDYLIEKYKDYQNKIIQYNKNDYSDNYKIRAIKNTKIEVFREISSMLEVALEEYTNINVSKIEIKEEPVSMPRMCDSYKNKICNGCGDC